MNKVFTKTNNNEIEFVPNGIAWSMYVPDGRTYEVYISVDQGEHYIKFCNNDKITGPTIFNCTNFNQGSGFMIKGLKIGEKINILL